MDNDEQVVKRVKARDGQILKHVIDDVVFQSARDIKYFETFHLTVFLSTEEIDTTEKKLMVKQWIQYYQENIYRIAKCRCIYFQFESRRK